MQVDAVVGVEAREDDGGDGRRKPILDRKIKKTKNAGQKQPAREKIRIKRPEKKDSRAAEQPLGGRTLGTGVVAPGRDHGDRSPWGGAVRKRGGGG